VSERLHDHEYREFQYWGWSEARCVLIGCRDYRRKLPNGCPKCGAGPYHRECLQKHMAWCGHVIKGELVKAAQRF
jgi:hypothetical protein